MSEKAVSDLIEAGDQEGIDYLLELILIENPIDNINFEEENESLQSAKRVYYYDESDESKFEKKIVGNEIIYSLPTMFVTKEALEQKSSSKKITTDLDKKLLSNVLKIYFNRPVFHVVF